MTENKTRTEEFHVNGEELLGRIKEIIRQGNIRRIIIKNKEDRIVMESGWSAWFWLPPWQPSVQSRPC
jgi:hypothetical protein